MGRWFSEAVNWLATHLVALGFLAFFVIAVVFRADLFSIFMKQPPRGASAEEKAVAEARLTAEVKARAERAAKARAEGHLFRPLEPGEAVNASKGATVEEKLPVPGALRPTKPAPVPADSSAGGATVSYAETGGEQAGAPEGQRSAGPSELAANTFVRNRGEDVSALPPETILAQARQAFFNGNLEKAEMLYREYIRRRPEDPDGFGELGNVYHALKRDKEAQDAYFQAGLRLKFEGDQERLERLKQWLEKAGDPRAKVLAR